MKKVNPSSGDTQVDLQRASRCGFPEVIFGEGKTPAQIVRIARTLKASGQPVLATRLDPAAARALKKVFPAGTHHPIARLYYSDLLPSLEGKVAVCVAGTSDQPIAEEAACTAEYLGCQVTRYYDIGVAGLHRLLGCIDEIRKAHVIIAVAGMEGTLPSVIGGLVDRPVIAVPTHIGYGAHFGGWTPLCSMLTSCSSGVTVVNIDNGFGAAFAAAQILRVRRLK
ncbi:MAG: nickel pincer cofactor biosynthesis protein LarB [Candidatus Methylacidiphilales bacterium]